MSWTVELNRSARKDLKSIRDRTLRRRLTAAMHALATDPRPAGAIRLQGYPTLLRIRVGDWRICYRIEDDRLVVLVITIAPRGEVYDRVSRREG